MATNGDHWQFKEYQPNGSDQRWFFCKNLAPAIAICDRRYASIAYLTFAYLPADVSGLPSSRDESTFFHIEDVEFRELEAEELSVHVASATKNGIKDFLFYTRDTHEFLSSRMMCFSETLCSKWMNVISVQNGAEFRLSIFASSLEGYCRGAFGQRKRHIHIRVHGVGRYLTIRAKCE